MYDFQRLIVFFLFLLINLACERDVNRKFNYTLTNDCFNIKNLEQNNEIFNLYISKNGCDNNNGKNIYSAIKTLNKAQYILKIKKIKTDIRIFIDSGTYTNQIVEWSFFNKSNIIIQGLIKESPPIFDGEGSKICFNFFKQNGKCSNVTLKNIKITNYHQGIIFNGDRDNPYKGWNGNNKIINITFENIGSMYSKNKKYSSSAICFVNSRFNLIKNCTFKNIININKNNEDILIHAVYLAHYSSNNVIENCKFNNVSGDPIRVRDESNNNIIKNNVFRKTGSHSYFSEWYCSSETTSKKCTKYDGECSSFGNKFIDNKCIYGYSKNKIKTYVLNGKDMINSENFKKRLISKRNYLR